MHQFTDTAGRTWELALTIGAVKRIKASPLQLDLLKLHEGKPPLLTRLGQEVELLIDLIWCLVEAQAKAQGLDDLAFVEGLGGDAASAAVDAFYAELTDFFRQLRRPHEMRAVEKQRALVRRAIDLAAARIDAIDPERELSELPIPGAPSTNSPAASALLPTGSPSGS